MTLFGKASLSNVIYCQKVGREPIITRKQAMIDWKVGVKDILKTISLWERVAYALSPNGMFIIIILNLLIN